MFMTQDRIKGKDVALVALIAVLCYNDYAYYGGAVAKDGDQVKTGFDIFLSNNFSKVDIDKLIKHIYIAPKSS